MFHAGNKKVNFIQKKVVFFPVYRFKHMPIKAYQNDVDNNKNIH